jgi:hypothetical protein
MERFRGLLRDTWWLWLGLALAGIVLAMLVSPVFLVTYPISLFSFLYFGLLRYDEQGHPKDRL